MIYLGSVFLLIGTILLFCFSVRFFQKRGDEKKNNMGFIASIIILALGLVFVNIDDEPKYTPVYHFETNESDDSNPSFKGSAGNQGHCTICGLDHYGNYICPHFSSQSGTTCVCGHSKGSHAYRN